MLEREIESTPPLTGPFPNLLTREVVRNLVVKIAETLQCCKFTPGEQHAFAIGMVRGAREVVGIYGDHIAAPFLADLLDQLNCGGVAALDELIEVVTGREIQRPAKVPDRAPLAQPAA